MTVAVVPIYTALTRPSLLPPHHVVYPRETQMIAQLTELGLTTYEAKAYVGLLRRDSSTAAQVARLTGVPRQRIYDVLASLVGKGLAVARPGNVGKYSATAPDIALERLLEDHRQ